MSAWAWVALGFVVWVGLAALAWAFVAGATRSRPPEPPAPWDPDRWGP